MPSHTPTTSQQNELVTLLNRAGRIGARTALYTTLAAWTAVTVFRNLDRVKHVPNKVSRFGVVAPNYRFFGPTPAMHDQTVVVRHRDDTGTLTPWQGLKVGIPRQPIHTIWAPFRRADKAFSDAVRELRRTSVTVNNIDALPTTLGYKMILHVIRNQVPHGPAARQIQFAICQTAEFEPAVTPRITFVSQFHDIATGTVAAEPH